MTGTLTILGRNKARLEWDTDSPASVEAARRAYDEATKQGAAPMDTTQETATPAKVNGKGFQPGEVPQDMTMVPRFAGGA